jgi:hypothetical protein
MHWCAVFTALFTALFTAFFTALFTALFTAPGGRLARRRASLSAKETRDAHARCANALVRRVYSVECFTAYFTALFTALFTAWLQRRLRAAGSFARRLLARRAAEETTRMRTPPRQCAVVAETRDARRACAHHRANAPSQPRHETRDAPAHATAPMHGRSRDTGRETRTRTPPRQCTVVAYLARRLLARRAAEETRDAHAHANAPMHRRSRDTGRETRTRTPPRQCAVVAETRDARRACARRRAVVAWRLRRR